MYTLPLYCTSTLYTFSIACRAIRAGCGALLEDLRISGNATPTAAAPGLPQPNAAAAAFAGGAAPPVGMGGDGHDEAADYTGGSGAGVDADSDGAVWAASQAQGRATRTTGD